MNLLQPFMLLFMGSKEAGWFTNTLIYLYPVTEHYGENGPFVLGFGKKPKSKLCLPLNRCLMGSSVNSTCKEREWCVSLHKGNIYNNT